VNTSENISHVKKYLENHSQFSKERKEDLRWQYETRKKILFFFIMLFLFGCISLINNLVGASDLLTKTFFYFNGLHSLIFQFYFIFRLSSWIIIYRIKRETKLGKLKRELETSDIVLDTFLFLFFVIWSHIVILFPVFLAATSLCLYCFYAMTILVIAKSPKTIFNDTLTALASGSLYLAYVGIFLFFVGKWIGFFFCLNVIHIVLSILTLIYFFIYRSGDKLNRIQVVALSLLKKNQIQTAYNDKKDEFHSYLRSESIDLDNMSNKEVLKLIAQALLEKKWRASRTSSKTLLLLFLIPILLEFIRVIFGALITDTAYKSIKELLFDYVNSCF